MGKKYCDECGFEFEGWNFLGILKKKSSYVHCDGREFCDDCIAEMKRRYAIRRRSGRRT